MLKIHCCFYRRSVLSAALLVTGLLSMGLPRNAPAESAENAANDSASPNRLQALVSALNTHVTNLELNSVTLQQQIGYLQAANQNLEDQIKMLKAANQQLRQDLQQQEDRYVGLENFSRDIQGQMHALQGQMGDLRRLQNDVVVGLQKQLGGCQQEITSCYSQISSLQNQLRSH